MTDLSDAVTLDQALAYYRVALDLVEPKFASVRARIESLPANDPEAKLWRAWLWHWEAFREAVDKRGDIDYAGLFAKIRELNDALPSLSSTTPPFSEGTVDIIRHRFRSAGQADLEVNLIMDEACKRAIGAPRNDRETAIGALRLHMARPRKSWPQNCE